VRQWGLRETAKDTYELYESHYRLKKLKCSVLPLQKAQDVSIDDAEAFIAHHQGG